MKLLLAVICSASLALAQVQIKTGSWAEVARLPPGGKVTVVHLDGSVARGTVEAAGDESISVRQRKSVRSFTRAEVARVAVTRKGGRAKYVGIGAAVGAGVGAGILGGVAAVQQRPGADENWTGIFAFVGAPFGAGPGALLGFLSSAERTIYHARPR